MKTVQTYSSFDQAMSAQAWLGANGLDSTIPDSNTAGVMPYVATYSGIRLQVEDAEYEKALELLKANKDVPAYTSSEKPKFQVMFSRSLFQKLIGFQILTQILIWVADSYFRTPIPAEIESFLATQYLSYKGALLCHDLYYPLLILSLLSLAGLFFLQRWARSLYAFLWMTGILISPFYSASITFGVINLFLILNCFLGGFILCLAFFSPLFTSQKQNA